MAAPIITAAARMAHEMDRGVVGGVRDEDVEQADRAAHERCGRMGPDDVEHRLVPPGAVGRLEERVDVPEVGEVAEVREPEEPGDEDDVDPAHRALTSDSSAEMPGMPIDWMRRALSPSS